jgi:glycine oxidase
MSDPCDVLIVGGGIIGLTAAYYLARAGLRVEVVDQGDLGQEASWAGAGILQPPNVNPPLAGIDRLRARSAAIFPELSADLKNSTGIDNGYLRSGGLEFVADGDPKCDGWRKGGIEFRRLAHADLVRMEPALADGLGPAYLLPGMAQVRNPRHVQALIVACRSLRVRFRTGCPVTGFEAQGNRVLAAKTGSTSIAAGRFVLTVGAWSDAILKTLGRWPGIKPVRGQIVLLNPEAQVIHHIMFRGKVYLVPRGDGRVLIGSTEEDVGFDKRTTAQAINDLLEFALDTVPAFAQAPVERTWAGLRPGSPDDLPFIGLVPGYENIYCAAGHFRAGIELSPGTGLALKELILGLPPPFSLDDFRLDRGPKSAVGPDSDPERTQIKL